VILFDTSVIVDCLTGSRQSLPGQVRAEDRGERLILCTIVLYEWLRGPRSPEEIESQEMFFPAASAVPYETEDARLSATLYRSVKRARSREADIAIAACAIRHEAALWTLNNADFADIPGLRLYQAKSNFS
jgi:predicted nucleic acid-binding protein